MRSALSPWLANGLEDWFIVGNNLRCIGPEQVDLLPAIGHAITICLDNFIKE